MHDWMEHTAPQAKAVHDDADVCLTTMQMALMVRSRLSSADLHTEPAQVISAAAFGKRDSWSESDQTKPPPGHTLAFRSALQAVLKGTFLRATMPKVRHPTLSD